MGNTIRNKVFVLVSIGLLALALLTLSWPRFQASFKYLPVEFAIKQYHDDQQIPSERLPVLIRFAQEAIARKDHYRFHDGLSQLHLLRGLDPYTPALERRPAYRQAELEASNSLQMAPAQPAAWLRLATVRWVLHDESETIIQPWKMSIFTGRTNATLINRRVEIGLAHYAELDDEGVSMLRDQLLLAWRIRSGALVRALAVRDRDLVVTRRLLADTDPASLAEMEAQLEKLR
jgi:hypothetical protein